MRTASVSESGRRRHALDALERFADGGLDPTPAMGALPGRSPPLQAVETLYPLWPALPPVNRSLPRGRARGDAALIERLLAARRAAAPVATIAASAARRSASSTTSNDRRERGGVSLYVPEHWDPSARWPLVVALHGGSGHGADFLWTWLREARSRGFIVLAPTAVYRHLVVADPRARWRSPGRDGRARGGDLERRSLPRSSHRHQRRRHLLALLRPARRNAVHAPRADLGSARSARPARPCRRRDKPIYLVHGALDWMFPVAIARMAHRELERWGAQVTYREIEDLSHTYPREENACILDWLGLRRRRRDQISDCRRARSRPRPVTVVGATLRPTFLASGARMRTRKPFFYGWYVAAAGLFCYGLGISPAYYSWGFFAPEVMEELQLSRAQVGDVFGIFSPGVLDRGAAGRSRARPFRHPRRR